MQTLTISLALIVALSLSACADTNMNEANKLDSERTAEAEAAILAKRYYDDGFDLLRKKRYEAAVSAFSKSIEQDPNYADTYFNRANAYAHLRRHEAAIEDYSSVINLKPKDHEAYLQRGYNKLKSKDFMGAKNDFNTVIELKPTHGSAFYSRGVAEQNLGELSAACDSWDRAAELGIDRGFEQQEVFCKAGKAKKQSATSLYREVSKKDLLLRLSEL